MPVSRHEIGPDGGSLILHTTRQGLAAQAGHDLTIEVTRWSGEVTIGAEPADGSVRVTADLGSLVVRAGTGGVKPLSERDKREIARIATDKLGGAEATFVSERITGGADGGGTIDGTLSLRGQDRPLRLTITKVGEDRYRGTGSVIQTEYRIKPYTGFLGALKVSDAVGVEAEFEIKADPQIAD